MSNFIAVKEEDGRYTIGVSYLSRKDAIELANLLSSSSSDYLKKFGLSVEAELMEVSLKGDASDEDTPEVVSLEEFNRLHGETMVKFESSHSGKSTYHSDFPDLLRGESKVVVRVGCSNRPNFDHDLKVSDLLNGEDLEWGEAYLWDLLNPPKLIATTRRN